MTQSTDRDITEIKSAIESIARSTEANTKAIATLSSQVADLADLTLEMRLGFANVDIKFSEVRGEIKEVRGDIKVVDTRLVEVEHKIDKLDTRIDKQDTRLWAFVISVLTITVGICGTLIKMFVFPNA
jgi:chromosome segregation ATPase